MNCKNNIEYKIKKQKNKNHSNERFLLVGDGGFEPPKALPADLQSVPFGHSGNLPYIKPTVFSRLVLELVDGLEPPTCWLQISCSTNWATPAYVVLLSNLCTKLLTLHYYNTIVIPCQEKIENILIFVCLWEKFVQLCLWVKINQFCKLVFNSVFAYIDRLLNKLGFVGLFM